MAVKRRRLFALIALGCVFACAAFMLEHIPKPARLERSAPVAIESREPTYRSSDGSVALAAPSLLHGLVKARGGGPLARAVVCPIDASGEVKVLGACVETDGAGRFGFSEMQRDSRGVLASLPGYRPRREMVDPATGTRDLVVELDVGGESLTGRVVDASGGSVGSAWVTLRGSGGSTIAVTSSAADGKFELANSPGAVEICAQAEAYSRTCSALGGPFEEYVLVLTLESKIVGRARRRADGSGIAGASVVASNGDGLRIPPRTISSGDDGTFSFDALPAGGYELVAVSGDSRSSEQWVAVGLGETSGEVTLWADSAVRMKGHILVGDAPCASGTLELSGPISARGAASERGSVDLDGIVPGHYEATADCDGALAQTVALDVRAESVERVFKLEKLGDGSAKADAAAPLGGSIRATIEGESAPVLAAFVQSTDGVPQRGRRRGAEYLFEHLPVGEYRVYFNDYVEQAESARIVREGDVVNVRLRPAKAAHISGRVMSDDGVPIADAWVSASRSDLMSIAASAPPTLTAADGVFNLAAAPGARYTLTVTSAFGNTELRAVKAGEDVQVRVRAPASLSGLVQTSRGEPVPEFTLAYRAEHDPSGYERRGGNSAFNLPVLEPDTYTLQVTSSLGSALEHVRIGPGEAATIKLTLSDAPRSPTN